MKKGGSHKKYNDKKKQYIKSSTNEEGTYKKYEEPKNVFNLASLDKIREESNNPINESVKKTEKEFKEKTEYNYDSEDNRQNEENSDPDSENSDNIPEKKFDIKLYMMVN